MVLLLADGGVNPKAERGCVAQDQPQRLRLARAQVAIWRGAMCGSAAADPARRGTQPRPVLADGLALPSATIGRQD